jgi:hypothetical protein
VQRLHRSKLETGIVYSLNDLTAITRVYSIGLDDSKS